MNFDEETLMEIEDYIEALDENVGLKVETVQDIAQAINKQRGLVKKINYEPMLDAVNCEVCGKELTEQEKEGGNCCDECWLRN